MKKKLQRSLAAALVCLMPCAALAEVELFAVNVGKGDALILRSGGYTCLIDTGKDKAQDQLEAALAHCEINSLDAVFITHTDKDHTGGLKWLRKSDIEIKAIYASRFHPETSKKKHQAVKTANKLDLEVQWLSVGDCVPLGNSGALLRVLAPAAEIPGDEDENSLVMMLESADGRILLTGDMEHLEEAALLQSGQDLRCDVLKIPNHGDDDAASAQLIAACQPKLAVISTDSAEKPGTPDSRILKQLDRASCAVLVTQDAQLGVRVALNQGQVSAEYINP